MSETGSPEKLPENVRVEYYIEATVNTGNFQNVRPGYRLSADVPDGVSPTTVKNKLKAVADVWLEQHIEEIQQDLNG